LTRLWKMLLAAASPKFSSDYRACEPFIIL
jgi:hypothetical protein